MFHLSRSKTTKAFSFITTLLIATLSITQAQTTYILDSSTNPNEWIVPDGVHVVRIECIGAGGGGGYVDLVNPITEGAATGGGGGGAYASSVLCVTPGETFSLNIGLGGSGQDGASNGGNTWFGNSEQDAMIKASGGSGVENNIATGGSGGSIQASIGDIIFAGGNGGKGAISGYTLGNGTPYNDISAGGGGGAAASNIGDGETGGDATASWTGIFSATYSGEPGKGGLGEDHGGTGGSGAIVCAKANQVIPLDAENGTKYGAGGGGGVRAGSSGSNRPMKPGGNGADGVIIITIIAKDITVSAGNDFTICEGEEVVIQGEYSNGGDPSANVKFQWSGIDFVENDTTITPTIAPTQSHLYTVYPIVEGCELKDLTDSVEVTIDEKNTAPLLSIENNSANNCHGREITINANGGDSLNGSNLEWIVSTGNLLNFQELPNNYISTDIPQETTTYAVAVSGNGSCGADTSYITYELPNTIDELALNNETATCYLSGDQPIHFYSPTSGRYIGSINPKNQEGNVTITVKLESSVNFKKACELSQDESFWTAYLQRKYTIDAINGQFDTSNPEARLPFLTKERTDLTLAAGDGNSLGTLTPNNSNDELINGKDDLGITLASGEICDLGTAANWLNQDGNGVAPNNISNTEYIEISLTEFGQIFIHASKTNSQLSLDKESLNTHSLITYPNPSNGQFIISVESFKQEESQFSIYDLKGRKIMSKTLMLSNGVNKIPFDISPVSSGTYLLIQHSNNNSVPMKLIIE